MKLANQVLDLLDEVFGHSFNAIADEIFKKLKNERDWEKKAIKMIRIYTKNSREAKEILNLLRGEDYFDVGEFEF